MEQPELDKLFEWCDNHMESRRKSVTSMQDTDAVFHERTIMDFSLEISIYQSFKNKIQEIYPTEEK